MPRRAEPFPTEGAFVVLDGKLRFWGASAIGARALQQPGVEEQLVRGVRALRKSGSARGSFSLETGEARVTALGGGRGKRFLIELTVSRTPTRNERLLTGMQLQVARRAAAGKTLQDIARALGRSPETIRTHLREVYRRLDVSNRIELARALSDARGR